MTNKNSSRLPILSTSPTQKLHQHATSTSSKKTKNLEFNLQRSLKKLNFGKMTPLRSKNSSFQNKASHTINYPGFMNMSGKGSSKGGSRYVSPMNKVLNLGLTNRARSRLKMSTQLNKSITST